MESQIIQIISNDDQIIQDLKVSLTDEGIETGDITKEYPNEQKFDPEKIVEVISKIAVIITSGGGVLKAIETFISKWKKVKKAATNKSLEIKIGSKVLQIGGVKDEEELRILLKKYLQK